MCYKCELCTTVVEAGQSRLVHTIYRTIRVPTRITTNRTRTRSIDVPAYLAKEVVREIAVCAGCKSQIDRGIRFDIPVIKNDTAPPYKLGKSKVKPAPITLSIPDRKIRNLYKDDTMVVVIGKPKKEKEKKIVIGKVVRYSDLKKPQG